MNATNEQEVHKRLRALSDLCKFHGRVDHSLLYPTCIEKLREIYSMDERGISCESVKH